MKKRHAHKPGNNVLLLDGGGTQTLPIAKSIHKNGHHLHIFYSHKFSYGYGTRYARFKVKSPSIKAEKEYYGFLTDYLIRNSIEVVIPMSDPSALLLSKYKKELSAITGFISPDFDVFMRGYDKNQLMTVCRENGFPHPETIDLTKTEVSAIPETFFPAILKPNLTTGGRGMKILNARKELVQVFDNNVRDYGPCHLQELIPSGGRQYKVELFLDKDRRLINASVIDKQRFYPVSGGSSCFNMTVRDDAVVDLCYSVLKKIGWIGFADFDLIEDPRDNVFKIMEINPRIPACVKSAVESGIDYGNMIVDASAGRELQDYKFIPGKQLRHLGFDILWFIKSKDRFRARTNWFNFFERDQSFQDFSLSDPLTFVYGTIGNIKKMSNEEFRKSKDSGKLT